MPEFILDRTSISTVSTISTGAGDVPSVAYDREGIRLRLIGVDPSRFNPRGTYEPTGWFQTQAIPMSALTEVFGIWVTATWPNGTDASAACAFQISLDGGATFLAWTGAAWVAQPADGAYTTIENFNDNCETLPLLNPKSMALRCRLSRGNLGTPRVQHISLYLEWTYNPSIDMYEYINARLQEVRMPVTMHQVATSILPTVTLETNYTIDNAAPVKVFNLNDDPNKNSNIFAGVAGQAVTLSVAPAIGDVIEIQYSHQPPIVLVHQDEMIRTTTVPSLELYVDGVAKPVRHDVGPLFDYKRGAENKKTRVRQHHQTWEFPVKVEVTTDMPRVALETAERIRYALSRGSCRSPNTGLIITTEEKMVAENRAVLTQGIDVACWEGMVRVTYFSNIYENFEGVQQIFMGVGSFADRWTYHEVQ
jgi:hypothetical protein